MPLIAVYDTNLWISRELRPGAASHCIWAAKRGEVQLAYCREMEAELDYMQSVLWELRSLGSEVEITGTLHVAADPDDDKFIECAVVAGASFLVSQDHHLLDVSEYEGVRIVSPADFLATLDKSKA